MGVVVEGQTVVPDVMGRVLRLHHGTQGHGLDELLLALAGGLVHEGVQRARDGALRAGGLQLVAEGRNDLAQVLQLLRIGLVVDAVDESLGRFTI